MNHPNRKLKHLKNLGSTALIPILFTCAALGNGACAKGSSANGSDGGSCAAPAIDPNAINAPESAPQESGEKVQLTSTDSSGSSSGMSTMSVDGSLKAGTTVAVLLHDECREPGEISQRIPQRLQGRTKSGVRSYSWTLPRDLSKDELSQMAKRDACVSMISSESVTEAKQDGSISTMALPSDPGVAQQKHLAAIGASEAYNVFYNPQSGIKKQVVIAIVDSGVLLSHEDLQANIWVNKGEIPKNGIDDDNNGYIDDVNGYNFASGISDPNPQRTNANAAWQWAHGTRVAGLAAAVSGNGKGITGVMGTAKIMALNNMGTSASMSQVDTANAIRYAVDNGADVVNLSLGGFSSASANYVSALRYAASKGVVVVAAAGNEASLIGSGYSAAGQASSIDGVISIGNFQAATFQKAPLSNYSVNYVELGAPGTYSTYELLYTTSPESTSSYSYFSGTSAATPVAAGAAALTAGLLKSRGYSYTAADIERLLVDSATKVPALSSYFKNGNALNLASLAKLLDQRYPYRGIGATDGSYAPGRAEYGDTACN